MKKNTIKTIMTIRTMKQSQVKLKSILDQKSQTLGKTPVTEDEDDKKGKSMKDRRLSKKSLKSKSKKSEVSGTSVDKQDNKMTKNKLRENERTYSSK